MMCTKFKDIMNDNQALILIIDKVLIFEKEVQP